VLKAVAKKRLVNTKDLHASYDYSENCSVWFSGTLMVGCGDDPQVVDGSGTQTETPPRDSLTRDSI
jgi:hypothetical protein